MLPPMVSKIFLWSGYYGVITFFVISGFLITTSSIRRWGSLLQVQPEKFYLIRFARIFPCLIALIILLSVFDRIGIQGFVINTENTSLPRAIFAALTFHVNWLEAQTGYLPAAWDILWSLSVEEAFYLCFPIICRYVKNELNFVLLMLCFIILGPFARVAFSTNDIWMDHSYLSCMDGIALGCLVALFASKFEFNNKALNIFMICGLILSIFIVVFRKQAGLIGLTPLGLNVTVLEIGVALLAIAFYGKSFNKNKSYSGNPLCWLGRNSYEIYLTHTFFVLLIAKVFYDMQVSFNFAPLWYLGIITLSGLCGHLISRYYSEPLNSSIRARFSKAKVGQAQFAEQEF